MRRSNLFTLLVALLPTSLFAQGSGLQVEVLTDRPDALYACGDKATFNIRLLRDKKPVTSGEVSYVLSLDGYKTLSSGKVTLSDNPASVTGALADPGFLRCQATFVEGKTTITGVAGAGFDPLKIKPSLPVPDDLDAFWAEQKKKLAQVPINPKLTPVNSPNKSIECFDLHADCLGGAPVSGYFARPAGAKPKSLPAILAVHGAGVRSSSLPSAVSGANMQMLSLDINAHGIPNGKPDDYYTKLTANELKEYRHRGRDSRETSYFLGMYLRLIRAIDFLVSQPEWDGKILIVRGGSQGGGQSLAAAGLDSRVTFIAAGIPAMCDHSGNAAGRIAGWPKLVPLASDSKPEPKALEAARYFDCMNLATRVKAGAIVSVGFIDAVCPPTGIYATYNNLPGEKKIVHEPLMGHSSTPRINDAFAKAIQEHLANKMRGK
jgi:cephalosporin-C deacetylase-like acetyl esterase